MNTTDFIGKRFGRLVVVGQAKNIRKNSAFYCDCDCGESRAFIAAKVIHGTTKSCGCLRHDLLSKRMRKHGLSKTTEYRSWTSMMNRCYSASNVYYMNYGGRGITVCDEWRNSFETFLADMGKKPSPECQIDRIDNNAGYSKANCRWVTPQIQQCNRRSNRLLQFQGKTQPVSCWAREIGLQNSTLHARLKAGWTIPDAITTPISKNKSSHFTME